MQSPHSSNWIDDPYSGFRSYVPKSKAHVSHHKGIQAEFCSALSSCVVTSLADLQTATGNIASKLSKGATVVSASNLAFDAKSKALTLTIKDNELLPVLWIGGIKKTAMAPLNNYRERKARVEAYTASVGE
jgi:hypothetical protein